MGRGSALPVHMTSWFRLAYDALREERGPKRGAQEYLAILWLAARRGEARVESAVRFLLGSQHALNAAETGRLTEDSAPIPLTSIAIDPVDNPLSTGSPSRPLL